LTVFASTNITASIAATFESLRTQDHERLPITRSEFKFLVMESAVRNEMLDLMHVVFQTESILDLIRCGETTESKHAKTFDELMNDLHSKFVSLSMNSSYTKGLCTAILTFLFLVRPPNGADNNLLSQLATQLSQTLGPPSIRNCASLEIVFWQHMIGAVAAAGTPARERFLTYLRKFVPALQLRSWDDAQNLLRRFFWIDGILSASGREIWNQL
jgi:hypothetical protein